MQVVSNKPAENPVIRRTPKPPFNPFPHNLRGKPYMAGKSYRARFPPKQSYYFESTTRKSRNAAAINMAHGNCINDFVQKPEALPERMETISTRINRPFD
ncbi:MULTISPECIES: hypothetical protein [Paraburkholderia]|uniref:Uncharacterized protein n=2 Tax=Paraburkholderia TaxID=1822464 RepID=A0ABU9SIY8_9BURK|nr:hypothetical protein [Paraburkholderia nodosa]